MDTHAQIAGNEKGMVMIYVAVLLMVLFGFLALAVDSGHLFVVRNELQNDADAAALKGAWHLYTRPSDPSELPTLQWDVALEKAQEMVPENSSDNTPLQDALVEVGYWNLDSKILQPTTMSPTTPRDVPAVRVTTSRSAGNNGGPVGNFFMQLFGRDTTAVGARPAVAVMGHPGTVPTNSLFPMALSRCMTDAYFDQETIPDPPPRIEISSPYSPGGDKCYTGQWTSLTRDTNNVPTIKDLMNNGNDVPLKVGDKIWIEPGTEASIYPDVADWLPEGGKDVIMPIIETGDDDLTTKGEFSITGFVTFHIDGTTKGKNKYVYGHFVNYFTTPPGTMPGGSTSNTLTNPLLVQ